VTFFGGYVTIIGGVPAIFGGDKTVFGGVETICGGVMAVFGGSVFDFQGADTVRSSMRKPSGSQVPPLTIEKALRAIGSFARWRMLRELASGEAREIGELARAGHCTYESASKHMRALRKAGVVVLGRGRLYSLSPSVKVDPDKREVDFGFLLARFDHGEQRR
jgi:hypothetical protein